MNSNELNKEIIDFWLRRYNIEYYRICADRIAYNGFTHFSIQDLDIEKNYSKYYIAKYDDIYQNLYYVSTDGTQENLVSEYAMLRMINLYNFS